MSDREEPLHTAEGLAAMEALEAAALAYLQTHHEDDTPLMLEGFVMMIQGRELSIEGADRSTNIWVTPDRQSVSTTLGLTSMLEKNIDMWYRSDRED